MLDLAAHSPDAGDHVETVRSRAAKLYPEGKSLSPQTRNDYYGRACYYASLPEADGKWAFALRDLEVAVTAQRFATWAPSDPSMAIFTGRNELGERASDKLIIEFKKMINPEPPGSYLELPLFEPHAAALKDYGLTEPADLLALTEYQLASVAKIHSSLARRWTDAARLHEYLKERDETDAAVRIQLLGLLLQLGVTSRAGLKKRMDEVVNRDKFHQDMVAKAAGMRLLPTKDQTILKWTEGL